MSTPATHFGQPSQAALDALDALFEGFGDDVAQQAQGLLYAALLSGTNPEDVAGQLADLLDTQLNRALTIARTELLDAYRDGALTSYRANSDVVGQWMWSADQSATTCAACLFMDGSLHDLDEDMDSHANCFPGDVLVSGPRPVGSTTRWYEGEIVEIETGRGYILPVTPNHPILTPHGWVAAGLLEEGSDVISRMATERPFATVYPHDHQIPAPIEQVAVTLRGTGPVRTVCVPTTPEDFHGDGGTSINCEVHIVGTDRILWDAGIGCHQWRQPFAHQQLCWRHTQLTFLARLRPPSLFIKALLATTHSLLSSLDVAAALRRSATSDQHSVRFGQATDRDARQAQTRTNDRARHAIGIGQRILRLAGLIAAHDLIGRNVRLAPISGASMLANQSIARPLVAQQLAFAESRAQPLVASMEPSRRSLNALAGHVGSDRILKVTRRSFSGHVYNLQTTEEWYIANNIIAHNCRCSPVPVTSSWDDILGSVGLDGSDIPDTSVANDYYSGADWFADQDADAQRGILGPAAYNAWQAGDLTLSDLVGTDSDGALYQRSLKEIGLIFSDYL